mmetsp:Transcript_1356/g.4068  ORF Transcript_1356/g.4068 Transcript_1356/m.4068 type:complete len:629 (+) Transcript_1356:334-2220(+)
MTVDTQRPVDVMYGSETGNAEEIARRIHSELKDRGFCPGHFGPMKSYTECGFGLPSSERKVTVFVVSTTGDGDPPQNASAMLRFLRKKTHPKGLLEGFDYAVLGLGDTNYTNFCNGSKRLEKALKNLGAKNIYYRGEADDEVGLEAVVEPWIDNLWPALEKYFACSSPVTPASEGRKGEERAAATEQTETTNDVQNKPQVQQPALEGIPTLVSARKSLHACGESTGPTARDGAISATVSGARRFTPDGCDKRAWHIEVTTTEPLAYAPGDSFGVVVRNSGKDVDELLGLVGEDGERVVAVYEGDKQVREAMKLKDLVATCCDLTSPAKKSLLRALAEHCADKGDKYRLLLWSSRTGRAEYKKEILESKATIVEVLAANPTCKPPIELLVDLLPELQPRSYSAASAPEVDGATLHFAFAVVEYKSRRERRTGVATGMLEQMCERYLADEKEGLEVELVLRPSGTFRPPEDLAVPHIMIGPGTGVAPFIGFLRQLRARLDGSSTQHGDTHLFFGCRGRSTDYLYQEEIESFAADGTLTKLHLAFSREQSQKVYVQDRMQEAGKDIADLLLNNSSSRIYVCGNGGDMAKGVHSALESILVKHGSLSFEDASLLMLNLAKSGRYLRDVWYWA